MKFYFLIMLLILSNNLNAELFVKKKVRFATCEEIVKTGNFKGAGMKHYTTKIMNHFKNIAKNFIMNHVKNYTIIQILE